MTDRMTGSYKTEDKVDPNLGTLRRCTFCGIFKPLSEFGKNGVDRDGNTVYRTDCKMCYNLRRKANSSRSRKAHSDFVGGMKRRSDDDVQFTHQNWKECLIYFEGSCAYCGKTPKRGQRLTKDHLYPVVNGGKTTPDNIVPACYKCNSSKGSSDFKEWFMAQPFFSQDRLNKIFKWRSIMRLAMPVKNQVNKGREQE